MSDRAKKPPAPTGRGAPGQDSGGLWEFWQKLVGSLSVQVHPSAGPRASANPVSRMEPVRQDRRASYDEALYRKTEGRAGTAPLERVNRERHYLLRKAADRAAGPAKKPSDKK